MPIQSFFDKRGPFPLAHLATVAGANLHDASTADHEVSDVAPFLDAGTGDITFLTDRKLLNTSKSTGATACLVSESMAEMLEGDTSLLITDAAEEAFARIIAAFYPSALLSGTRLGAPSATEAAHIDPTAKLESDVAVEPGAVIGPEVEIGAGTIVCANAVIGAHVKIGRDCVLGAGSSVIHSYIGNRVIIHSGARIGEDGFGFAPGPTGFAKIAQLGRVIIQDDVEVGANATIDRGAMTDTVIGQGTKIDNLVQIAHNVQIGRSCAFAAQVGLSGSSKVGNGVVIGGQAGTIPYADIGDGAQVAAGAGIAHRVAPGERVAGRPHKTMDKFRRELVAIARLSRANS